jgi:hypothetical protein
MLIFLFPMALSVAAALMILFGDYGPLTKVIVVALVAVALSLQFIPPLAQSVHFLVPLFIQLIVCGWWYFASQFE